MRKVILLSVLLLVAFFSCVSSPMWIKPQKAPEATATASPKTKKEAPPKREAAPPPKVESAPPPKRTAPAQRQSTQCCKQCSARSKPCGDSCISRQKACHKSGGCAC